MVAGAYLASALVVLGVIFVLRVAIAPQTLKAVLAFYFIASLAAGLEPATVKAWVLADGRPVGDIGAVLAASGLKAFAAAPVLALIWRLALPGASLGLVLLTPLLAVAGFWATDLRVLLDLRGRHAAAVWLKQGGLAGGFVLLAILVVLGAPLSWAALISALARLVPPLVMLGLSRPGEGDRRRTLDLFADAGWPALAAASAIAAAGGSIDRLLALRWLPAADYAGYLAVYELFTRFWLIPYLVAPVLFARLAGGDASRTLMTRAWLATALIGAVFVGAVAGVVFFAPGLALAWSGIAAGPPVIAFAAAVVIGALTQLRIARMQGGGAARRALLVIGLGALVSAAAFVFGIRALGAQGLFWAWLVKSAIEFAAAMAVGVRPDGRLRAR